jgi:adenylyltransferase/sulfurtransferase
MKELEPKDLKKLKDGSDPFTLIDVREPHEYNFVHIDGKLIPMGEVPQRVDEIPKDHQVVVMCRSGKRSGDIIRYLENAHGYENLYNLRGGILAYSNEVDPSLPKY